MRHIGLWLWLWNVAHTLDTCGNAGGAHHRMPSPVIDTFAQRCLTDSAQKIINQGTTKRSIRDRMQYPMMYDVR